MTENESIYMVFGYGFISGTMVCLLIHHFFTFISEKKKTKVLKEPPFIPLEFQVDESAHQLTLLKTSVMLAESRVERLDSKVSRLEIYIKEMEQMNNYEYPKNVVPFVPKD